MTIPSSSLGIGLEVKVGMTINVNLMSTHFVYSRVILTAASLASKSKLHHSNSLSILVTLAMGCGVVVIREKAKCFSLHSFKGRDIPKFLLQL